MNVIPLLMKEFESEVNITRKMLERVPGDKFDWKPHEKCMTLKQLTGHIAELPGWVKMIFNTSELDFAAQPYVQPDFVDTEALLKLFEQNATSGRESLHNAKEEDLLPQWTLRNGGTIYSVMTKYEVVRHSLNQTTHHRAQLGVFLRLLDVAIPGSYGPSADDMSF